MWIKGSLFSVRAMLGPKCVEEAEQLEGGSLVIFRLAPQDYHRFHCPVDGTLIKSVDIPGWYHSVNPICVNHRDVNVFTENHRVVNFFRTEKLGLVCMVNIGANVVGSVVQLKAPGETVKKGECFGYYQYGGSTTILVTEPGAVQWDDDIVRSSTHNVETYLKMGERIGAARK
jgi:phosphatidylserine decarboxylase